MSFFREREGIKAVILSWKIFYAGIFGLVLLFPLIGMPQVIGEVAELDRLEQQAEEAMAQGDSQGAALSIGKAALMSSILVKQGHQKPSAELWKAAGQLFRGQEDTYRALALFEQAGGTPPPPGGVCQALRHSLENIQQVQGKLHGLRNHQDFTIAERAKRYWDSTQDWKSLIPELIQDISC